MESVFLSELINSKSLALGAVLKAAYLTTHRTRVFGSATGMVQDWSSFRTQSPKLKRQILLTSFFEDINDAARHAYTALDSLKGVKYLNATDLRLKAICDDVLKKLEGAFIEGMNESIAKFRLNFYSELKKEGEPLVHGLMLTDELGDPPFGKNTVSEAMILKFEFPGETPDVFWLEPEFFDPEHGFELQWVTHPSAFTPGSEVAQLLPLFELPSTSHLTATETKYLKQELKPQADAWNEAMDPLLDYYLRRKGEKPGPEILQGIEDKSKELNETIALSPLLAGSRENDESMFYHPLQVILGFLPTPMLWKFYEAHNNVNVTTMEMLEQFKTDPAYIAWQPVILVKSKMDNYFDSDEQRGKSFVPAELKAVKKSIDI